MINSLDGHKSRLEPEEENNSELEGGVTETI